MVVLDSDTSGGKFRQETRTDREGEYVFAWLPPGRYAVGLPGTLSRLGEGINIQGALPAGADVEISFQGRRRPPGGARFAAVVRCVDEAGAPVAGAEVAFRALDFHALPLLTGEDGVARAEGFPVALTGAMATREGFLAFAGPLPAAPGAAEATFVLRRQATVRVIVLDEATGEPLRRARCAVEHPGGVAENIDELLRPPRNISPDGGFALQVLPGPAVVRAACPGFRTGECPVEVPAGGPPGPLLLRLAPREAAP